MSPAVIEKKKKGMTDAILSTYTQGYHESITRGHAARTPENSAAFLLPHLRPDARVLDVGCGPGSITDGLAKYVPIGSIIGVDISDVVLEQAERRRKSANVTHQTGDITSGLAFPDHSFDVVYCHQFLIHMTDPIAVMTEMKRVCKTGGIVACREADFGTVVSHPPRKGTDFFCEHYIKTLQMHGMEPFAGRNLQIWARHAGFDPNMVGRSASTILNSTDAERDWWASTLQERFRGSDLRNAFQAAGATEAELKDLLDGLEEWKPDPDGWTVRVQGEVICRC